MSSAGRATYQDRNMQLRCVSEEGELQQLECTGSMSGSDFKPQSNPFEHCLGKDAYTKKVLVNLEKTTMLDSSGVSWLITSHRNFRDRNGILVLHTIPPMVHSVLKLLHMEKVLHLAEDVTGARALALK